MNDEIFAGDGLLPDAVVAAALHKHVKSLRRWDADARMAALGWPAPIAILGRNHRPKIGLRGFVANAAAATINNKATLR